MVGDYVQGALRKDLIMAPSIEPFKTTTLGCSYRCILPVPGTICKNVAFLSIFSWQKVMDKALYERSCTFFLSFSTLKELLQEVLLMIFASTWNNLFKHCIFVHFLLKEGYVQGALRKELCITPFVERFKVATLGRSC